MGNETQKHVSLDKGLDFFFGLLCGECAFISEFYFLLLLDVFFLGGKRVLRRYFGKWKGGWLVVDGEIYMYINRGMGYMECGESGIFFLD